MYDDMYKEFYGEEYGQSWYSVIPLAFLVSVVPLIVYGKFTNLTGDYFKYWNGSSQSIDFFSYYKSIWIMLVTAVALIVFGIKFFSKDIKIHKNKIYVPMGIYTALVILSTIFSEYKEISLCGFVERYEGMILILSYMVILFITINLVTNNKTSIKVILIALICSSVIIGLIGLFQYLGYDFYKSETGKHLMLPSQYQSIANKLKFQFGDKIIYSTLYHYDYVGSYMAMIFPLTFTLFILIKNKIYKVTMALVTMLMFLNLILCHSRAGFISAILAVMVLGIILREYLIERWKFTVSILAIAVIGTVGFNIYSHGMVVDRIGSLFKDTKKLAKGSEVSQLKDIVAKGNSLQITFTDKTLQMESNSGKLTFKDDTNSIIESYVNKENHQVYQILFKNNKFKDFNINIKDGYDGSSSKYSIDVYKEGLRIPLLCNNDHFSFIDSTGKPLEIKDAEKWGGEGKEKLGSSRIYIWSRSIPLLKHAVVLGYGPDTFAAKFPQDDYVGKLIAYDKVSMIVDKAHNLYLQIALNTGILSLIAFMSMIIIYFISSIKLYLKNTFEEFWTVIGLAIFVGICGYLGSGFFNDSVVSVAPVFWVLFGIGISVNYKLLNDVRIKEK